MCTLLKTSRKIIQYPLTIALEVIIPLAKDICYLQKLPIISSEEFVRGLLITSDTPYEQFARGLPIPFYAL
jgi:hypothetical protein